MHWVRLTDEPFPRLSVVRTIGKGLLHLGPFRSKRAADRVVRALWDATSIRRCSGPGRNCHYAQLGVAVCPCDGSVTPEQYAGIVDRLVDGLTQDPSILHDGVQRRLGALCAHQRFEEAADCRDAWQALSATIDRHRQWTALQDAGRIVARRERSCVAVDRGRLVGAWTDGAPTPLLPAHPAPRAASAMTMVDADEATLLWKWLHAPETEFLHADQPLVAPTPPIPALAVVA